MPRASPPAVAVCMRIAASQHGVLAAEQAIAVGLSRPAIRRLVRSGAWARVRPCVYALWVPEEPKERWSQRLTAAALWLGDAAAVSHRAAAIVWALDRISVAPIELSTTGRHRSPEAGLVLHRVRALPNEQVTLRGGIRITSVPRTLIDLCAVAHPRVVEVAFESAIRLGLSNPDEIRTLLANSDRRLRRAVVLENLVNDFPDRATESALESLVWGVLRDGGLPRPARQYEVCLESGVLIARVDFAYPEALVAVEADGHEFHSSRRDWQRDRVRQNNLIRLGWRVYRITWEDATRRAGQVVRDVAALLSDGGRRTTVTQNVRQAYVLGRNSLGSSRTGI